MADRFPSIEDVEEGQTETGGGVDFLDAGADEDDFLSRERNVLGADADQFQSDMPTVTVQDGDDDLLGDMGGQPNGTSSNISQFQSSFPAVDTGNEAVAPGGSITGTGFGTSRAYSPAPSTSAFAYEEEPQVIKDWREQRDASIAQREEVSTRRKEETVQAAQQAIDEFYENYNNKKEKGITQTRKDAEDFLKNREDTAAGGTSWDRIAKLVDVKGAGKTQQSAAGKERFRDLLLSLSKDENAPGAKGY